MESLTASDTPPIHPRVPEFIARHAKQLSSPVQPHGKDTVFIAPDTTTGWHRYLATPRAQDERGVCVVSNMVGDSFTGTASVVDLRLNDMTRLLADVALHINARGEWLTRSVSGITLKSAVYLRHCGEYSPGSASDTDAIAGVLLSDEARMFVSAHALRAYLADTINMIRRIFANVSGLQILYEHDSETEQEWLSIGVTVSGEIDQILEQYDSYVKQYNRLVPWPVRSLMRLSYEIC